MTKASTVSAPVAFKSAIVTAAITAQTKAIVHAFEGLDQATSKASDAIYRAANALVQAAITSGLPKNEKSTKWLMDQIKAAPAFVNAVAVGMLEQKTVNNYVQGMARAFFHGGEWTARAFQSEERGGLPALPWSKGAKAKPEGAAANAGEGAPKVTTPGKATTVTKDTAFGQARALLATLRSLNLDSVAAEILDAMLEVEGFSETTTA